MNPLAEELNRQIEAASPELYNMLSDLGKRIYFPSKGILAQGAEAAQKATLFNATIGTAMEKGKAMNLPCLINQLPGISPNDALLYAPSQGKANLRKLWQQKELKDNPDMAGKPVSLPLVTCGLTHGLSIIADMVTNPGDILILPNQNWGNYKLNFCDRKEAVLKSFELFNEQKKFNIAALEQALKETKQVASKAIILLNFPNNPTGYTPNEQESQAIADLLKKYADAGLNLVVIIDDAYYGLFYDEECIRQSIFTKLAGLHKRIWAFKADAATKEVYVWGLRTGFISFSIGGVPEDSPVFDAVNAKMAGLIRSLISNAPALSEYLISNALTSPDFFQQRAEKAAIMKERAQEVARVLANPAFAEAWEPYPFNSGYFMCLKIKKITASKLRSYLLDTYHIGTIAINETDLRIAFSCLEKESIQQMFDTLFQAWKDLANQ